MKIVQFRLHCFYTKWYTQFMSVFFHFSEDEMHYYTKKCSEMTEQEIADSSLLFSSNYGKYSRFNHKKKKQGKQIKLGINYYKNLSNKNNTYVAQAFYS